ncbi:MAG: diguanylate cyclase [Candidatus Sericytochromatia bacterium]
MATGILGQLGNRDYRSKVYFWTIFSIGFICFLFSLNNYPITLEFLQKYYLELIFFFAINILTELSITSIPTGGFLTASFSVISTLLIVHGPVYAILSSILAAIIGSIYTKKRKLVVNFFNAGLFAIILSLAGFAVDFLKRIYPFSGKDMMFSIAICSFTVTAIYMLMSSLIVNFYIVIDKKINFWETLKEDKWEFVQLCLLTPLSIISVYFYKFLGVWATIAVFLPAVFTVYFIRSYITSEQANQSLKELTENLTELYEFTKKINGKKNLKDLWLTLIRETEAIIPYDNCMIYKIDYDKSVMFVDGSEIMYENFKPYDLMDEGPLQKCAAKRNILLYEKFEKPATYENFWQAYNSALLCPLILKGEVMGVFCMMSHEPNAYSEEDVRFLKLLIGAVESSMINIDLYEQTQKQALVDGLTGLYNQKYFKAKVSDELKRATSNKLETSVIIMDMDYFKKFNDTHGHLLGDLVLKDLASIIKSSAKNNYVVSRYGGEEFAVLLPETFSDEACEIAEKIRVKVLDHKFTGREQREIKMTVSIGVNTHSYQNGEISQIEFIDRADTALYRAKNEGRNQVYRAIYNPEKDTVFYKKYSKDEIEQLTRNTYVFTLDKKSCEQWKEIFNKFEDWVISEENQNSFDVDKFYLRHFIELVNKKLSNIDKKLSIIFDEENIENTIFTKVKFPTDFYKFETDLEEIEKTLFDYIATLKFPEIEKEHIRKIIVGIFNRIYALAIKYTSNHYQKIVDYHTNISHINSEIGSLSTKHTFYANITKLTSEILNSKYSFIAELDYSKRFISIKSFYGSDAFEETLQNIDISNNKLIHKMIHYGESISIKNNYENDLVLSEIINKLDIKSGVLLPLTHANKDVFGIIGCFDTEEKDFTAEEIKIFQEISERVVKALTKIDKNISEKDSYIEIIKAMIDIFESKQNITKDHSKNVSRMAGRIAKAMNFSSEEEHDIRVSAYLHDIGKIGLSDEKLADDEGLKSHTLIGSRIISSVFELRKLVPAIKHHHENWDGSGYPDGLQGEDIPLYARIVAFANGFEKYLREYKDNNTALEKMQESELFDPNICDIVKNKLFISIKS